ncbi:hypothetical protein BDY17DRAFT_286224 [Neohortaea acidophila]|uniref:DNA mismatch repair protein PMS1 n=1 Tax=Neohortaea acidophila TaxID=245834 RepID=A0A6A6PHK8_9PEZI|nr:uncharacterized protein BDY17DRAFT_286224 [Neohortaea acidophila]KAF2479489.1 hypothetical protein BDY17DRAFT_286224 [Neohortaea acidophila]
MATIKAIEGRSVHQIQSGQVIVDLVSVVKELVENSLDAGATSIEVRFKNQGLDSIEVQDNGKGIAPEDFETIALKHYTSKLSSYEDLTSLDTFGFRGEALSSLCALSNFHIITARAEDGAVGKRLDFEVSGQLRGTSVSAAQRGTTVSVENLFAGLPVRRKELEKNIKREYGKALNNLYAYACISVGVRISVSNQMPKAKKTALFATQANPTTKENIMNVFGSKTLLSLVQLDLELQMAPSSTRSFMASATEPSMEVHVHGHISKPIFGQGRQAPDRQMFFVNSRPCSLPQVAKVFNEVYKSFNLSQTPFIFANLVMDTNAYDVNVSPDKRSILLHDQAALLENLKASLTGLFDTSEYAVPQSQMQNRKLPNYQPLTVPVRADAPVDPGNDSESELESGQEDVHSDDAAPVDPPPTTRSSLIHNWIDHGVKARKDQTNRESSRGHHVKIHGSGDGRIVQRSKAVADMDVEGGIERNRLAVVEQATAEEADKTEIRAVAPGSQKLTPGPIESAFDRMRPMRIPMQTAEVTIGDKTTTTVIGSGLPYKRRRIDTSSPPQPAPRPDRGGRVVRSLRKFAAPGSQLEIEAKRPSQEPSLATSSTSDASEDDSNDDNDEALAVGDVVMQETEAASADDAETGDLATSDPLDKLLSASEEESDGEYVDEAEKKIREDEKVARLIHEAELAAARPTDENLRRASQVLKNVGNRKDTTLHLTQYCETTMVEIQELLKVRSHEDARATSNFQHRNETAIVKNEIDDSNAESRLALTVSKSDFEQMTIIGQFNLGFILAVRAAAGPDEENQLFIIDQHAADEKYNYERFQRTVTLQNQRLVRPKRLDVTAVEEEIIVNHPEALKANGFEIDTTSDTGGDDESPRRTFRLITLPMSREKTFQLSDLEELLHLLAEAPAGSSEIPRPKKVQSMLAMRACRSSIMIGKTLTLKQMQSVVRHMGEMEKPWNCPHGRPTMRHLAGLGAWNGWLEGDAIDNDDDFAETAVGGRETDWGGYLGRQSD